MADRPALNTISRLVDPVGPARPAGRPAAGPAVSGDEQFAQVLARRAAAGTETVNFSKHALERLTRRGIDVTAEQRQRLTDGVALATAKGSQKSAVLVDDLVFVVGVPSRTVITAIDHGHMNEKIFTGIDSAVLA